MSAFYSRDPDSVLFALIEVAPDGEAFQVPREYRSFRKLFEDAEDLGALPEHKPWDHEIPLIEGKQPTAQPIYSLSEKELEALREYIDKNQKKGYIRPSKSPARLPFTCEKPAYPRSLSRQG